MIDMCKSMSCGCLLQIQLQPFLLLLLINVKCNLVYISNSFIPIYPHIAEAKMDLQSCHPGNYSLDEYTDMNRSIC